MKPIVPFLVVLALPLSGCGGSEDVSMQVNADAPVADLPLANVAEGLEPTPVKEEQPAGPRVLTPAGLGPVGIGMPVAVAGAGTLEEDETQISEGCRTLKSADYPRAWIMSNGKHVTRITLMRRSDVKTAAGIGPGSTEEEVRKAYSSLREEPHKYVSAPAKNLYWEPDGKNAAALRFEIGDGGTVTAVHAGLPPYISYVEGCA